jgi:deazaflavin-dependent oxidoreductase (nitroreductase family)
MTTSEVLEKFKQQLMSYPSQMWQKWLFKFPLILWRMGLGPLLGHHLLVITAWGRKSGLPRHTMVEYHVRQGKIYVPSAYGDKAQWYQNLMANPHATIQTWQGAEPMVASRVTDGEELFAIAELMMQNNPVMMPWYLEDKGVELTREDVQAHKDAFYFLRFDPTTEPTPLPLEVDLAWLWPVVLVLALLRGKRLKRKLRRLR